MEQAPREYELARLILRLSNQIVRNRNLHVKELGLTTAQADSLRFFLSHENAVITDLKEHLGVTHQTAQGIVRRMEQKGLICTRKSEVDGRYQCILPTEKGRQIGEKLVRNGIRTGGKLLQGMDFQQQKAFFSLLTTALENVEQGEKNP